MLELYRSATRVRYVHCDLIPGLMTLFLKLHYFLVQFKFSREHLDNSVRVQGSLLVGIRQGILQFFNKGVEVLKLDIQSILKDA